MKQFLITFVILANACSFAFSQKKDTKVSEQFTKRQKMDITPLVTSANIASITMSPDGKYVAYATADGTKQSLRLRQLATKSETEIVSVTEKGLGDLSFTPDSTYIYYRHSDELYRVPALGGSPIKISGITDKYTYVSTAAAFAADGKRIAFTREDEDARTSFLQVANSDGSEERLIIKYSDPTRIVTSHAWSPDGRIVAYGLNTKVKDEWHVKLVGINVSDNSQRQLSEADWAKINDIVWLPNGNLVVTGKLRSDKESEPTQVWLIPQNARPQIITREPFGYQRISATSKGDMLLALQFKPPYDFWITPTNNASVAKQITTSGDILGRIRWVPGGKLAFSSFTTASNRDISTMNVDGTNRKQLTADQGLNLLSSATADGRFIFFVRTVLRNNVEISNVWRMNADGTDQRQMTNGTNDRSPRPSPDGKWLYYTEVTSGDWNICKLPIDGGTPAKIATKKMSSAVDVSPRTGMIAYINDEDRRKGGLAKLVIITADNKPIKTLSLPQTAQLAHFQWTPDESAITFQDNRGGGANIWAMPVAGDGEAKPITNFTAVPIVDYDLSPDGKQILLTRAVRTTKAVLIHTSKSK